jgi:hypothetical protein
MERVEFDSGWDIATAYLLVGIPWRIGAYDGGKGALGCAEKGDEAEDVTYFSAPLPPPMGCIANSWPTAL